MGCIECCNVLLQDAVIFRLLFFATIPKVVKKSSKMPAPEQAFQRFIRPMSERPLKTIRSQKKSLRDTHPSRIPPSAILSNSLRSLQRIIRSGFAIFFASLIFRSGSFTRQLHCLVHSPLLNFLADFFCFIAASLRRFRDKSLNVAKLSDFVAQFGGNFFIHSPILDRG